MMMNSFPDERHPAFCLLFRGATIVGVERGPVVSSLGDRAEARDGVADE